MSTSINQNFTTRSLLKFALPSIIMMVFMSCYTIVDGIFVSRFVGSNALSAVNIVYPIEGIVVALATMLATGGNAIISKHLGQGKPKEARIYDPVHFDRISYESTDCHSCSAFSHTYLQGTWLNRSFTF